MGGDVCVLSFGRCCLCQF